MEKKIEELEKRIKELENKLNQSSDMFGRSYSQIGSSNSDVLIKTKGKVKIQYGNKLIDLIKDGKINSECKFIYTGSTVGNKEGIWIINNEEIWLKPKDSEAIAINTNSEYLSYLIEQELTAEQQLQALLNIGFFVNSQSDINTSINKLVYVLEDQMLYIVSNGTIIPLVSQTVNNTSEATTNELPITYDGNYVIINNSLKISPFETITQQKIVCNKIQSENANQDRGFILNYVNGKSQLIVDQLIVRDGSEENQLIIYPEFYFSKVNLITSVSDVDSEENIQYKLELQNESEYQIGDILYVYIKNSELDNDEINGLSKIKLTVVSSDSYTIIVESGIILNTLENSFIFSESGACFNKNGIDIHKEGIIKSRFGDLTSLDKSTSYKEINGYGIYSEQGYFTEASYTNDYSLSKDDNSTKFASTEWVNEKLNTTVDVDFTIYNTVVNIADYFQQENIWQLYLNQKNNTTITYVGYYGVLTINKTNHSFSAIVRARSEDNDWTHRSINGTYKSGKWSDCSSYIIKNYFNSGYYWSKDFTNNKPSSTEYIGTTDQGFTVSEDKPYLLYTNDGKTWTLIDQYITPDPNRIYICSTASSGTTISETGQVYNWPAGFLCYYYNQSSTITKLGKSNYISVKLAINNLPTEELLATLLVNAEAGKIPHHLGYYNLWSIDKNADKTNPTNWKKEQSSSSVVNIVHTETDDWGNSSTRPGYKVWEIDENNTIIGEPAINKFLSADGTEANWGNLVWRRCFLETILSSFLTENKDNYNPTLGWRFNYNGVIKSIGFAGYWSARIGELLDPTSDDETNIGYTPTSTLTYLSGQVIQNGMCVQFIFKNVKLGKILPYRYGNTNYAIGDKLYSYTNIYEASYDSCSYKINADFNTVNM